jgi:N-acetylglucosaminyl-diphospho-decaprenol L-rhamnosyltransferase
MISLLVVNFRSAALAAEAVRTARATTTAPLQVVIVDNSCDPREAEALQGVADTLMVMETNRGYAGGINAGRRACTGDTIVVSNPDVTFAPAALDLLAGSLGPNVAVAGPALFWDDAHLWHLPPGDLLTAPQKLDELLAGRSQEWSAQRDRRRFRQRVAFWSLEQTTRVRMLSGAVLAIRAEDFDELGGFDERFALYFEETDFLRRISERRKRIVYVPRARCRHIYNQSAAQTGRVAAERYAESQRRYLEKWNGPLLAGVLERLERPPHVQVPPALSGPIPLSSEEVVVEASPLPSFSTAAGFFPQGPGAGGRGQGAGAPTAGDPAVGLPEEVLRSAGGAPLYMRVIACDTARVLAAYKITP